MEPKIKKGSDVKQRENLVPNDDVQRCAENEEPMFLSLMLRNKDFLDDVMKNTLIDSNSFLIANNGRFFGVMAFHYIKYETTLTEAAFYEITRDSSTQANDKIFYDKIYRMRCDSADFSRLKSNLINRHIQQQFYETAFVGDGKSDGLVNQILSAKDDQPKLLASLQDKLMEINNQCRRDGGTKISGIAESLDKVMTIIDDRRRDPEAHWGFRTSIKGIDDTIFGIHKGEYAIIAGYPNGGKTTTLINLAIGLSKNGAKVGYVTVESTDIQIAERILSHESEVPSKIIKDGNELNRNDKYYLKLLQARESLKELMKDRLTIVYVPRNIVISELLSIIDMKRRALGFDVVIVDYLDVIKSITSYPSRPDLEIGEVSVLLQAYGGKHGIAMITAQSFNNEMIKNIKKQLAKSSDKDVNSSVKDVEDIIGFEGIGGSQKLSRDADYVWGLMLGNNDQRLVMYWLKSRNSEKAKPIVLNARLNCCKLQEIEDMDDGITTDYDSIAEHHNKTEAISDKDLMKNAEQLPSVIAMPTDKQNSNDGFGQASSI